MKKIKEIIAIGNYGETKTSRPNTVYVKINNLKIYFSYEDIIAFSSNGILYVSENIWSKTTGKHINYIEPRRKNRLPYDIFKEKLREALIEHNLIDLKKEIIENLK